MTRFLITAILVAIPTYFYTRIVQSIDRFEKEPPSYLVAAFLWGAMPAVIAALVLQIVLGVPVAIAFGTETLSGEFIEGAVNAPVTEEFLKGMAVAIIYFTRRREFDGWVDGIVYGAMAGFGFAYVENILYLVNTHSTEEWITLFILRLFVFGGLHGFWTALTGIGFGVARYLHNPFVKVLVISGGLLSAMFGHFIHNGALTLAEVTEGQTALVALINYGMLALFMLVLWFVAGYNDRQMLQTYLADEVPDIISPENYAAICKIRANALARLNIAPKYQRAFIQAAAELAQKKLQLSKMGEEEGNSIEIAQLREELKKFGSSS